jgi:hypothetical protein
MPLDSGEIKDTLHEMMASLKTTMDAKKERKEERVAERKK